MNPVVLGGGILAFPADQGVLSRPAADQIGPPIMPRVAIEVVDNFARLRVDDRPVKGKPNVAAPHGHVTLAVSQPPFPVSEVLGGVGIHPCPGAVGKLHGHGGEGGVAGFLGALDSDHGADVPAWPELRQGITWTGSKPNRRPRPLTRGGSGGSWYRRS